ncbi:MAG: NADH-quinone oxidoreductase subunit M [Methylococcaceae bacterium]|jgi:NADH-quinone oxidoreductase subunit M
MPTEFNVMPWQLNAGFPVLSALTLVPLAAIVAVILSRSNRIAKYFAFIGAGINLALSVYLLWLFDSNLVGIQLAEHIHTLGMSYFVGIDGMNILFIPLTAVLTLLALIYTLITRHRNDRQFIACLLAYEAVLIGAFSALNLIQFWLWTLLELIPVALLTINAGTGQKRNLLVARLLQYWGWSLAMTLTGFLLLGFGLIDSEHPLTFDWLTLKQNNAYLHDEILVFIFLFYGFAIRMPLFPFHGWLPLLAEHGTVASAAIFMVGLKLGIYGVVRFILPLVPGVAENWSTLVLTLGIIGMFYGALLALMQINIRRLLAFAVISHTGMLIIGIFCFNARGLQGSLLLCLSYGLATAGILFSVGLIYERTRTAFIPRLGALFDSNATIGLLFLAATLSTIVMPGTPGFDAAHLLIEGTIQEFGWLIAIAILIGNVLAAAFLLRAFQRIFMANSKRAVKPHNSLYHPVRIERIIAISIIALLIGIGFDTTPVLRLIERETTDLIRVYPMHAGQASEIMPEAVAPNNNRMFDKR